MFGMGWGEIFIIVLVALLVIGPESLPDVARTLGRTVRKAQRIFGELRNAVNLEEIESGGFSDGGMGVNRAGGVGPHPNYPLKPVGDSPQDNFPSADPDQGESHQSAPEASPKPSIENPYAQGMAMTAEAIREDASQQAVATTNTADATSPNAGEPAAPATPAKTTGEG